MRGEGAYSKMDVGSKEVLIESPPVSMTVCVHVCELGPASSKLSEPVSLSTFIHLINLGLC